MQRFVFLQSLAFPLSNLIYVIGLKVFLEIAPLNTKLANWLESGVYIFGVFVVLSLVRKAALFFIEWSTARTHRSMTLDQGFIPLFKNLITLFVFASGSIMILKYFKYDVMSLLTALGVGSLAIGLAAKETLSNMISGFTLIMDRNFAPGDRINLSGFEGEVETIGLRSTKLRLGNGNTLIVPNAELVNTKILNLSKPSRAGLCSLSLRFSMDFPFSEIKSLCHSVIHEVSLTKKDREQNVTLTSIAEKLQVVRVTFWIADSEENDMATSEYYEKLIPHLKQKAIHLAPSSLTPCASPPR